MMQVDTVCRVNASPLEGWGAQMHSDRDVWLAMVRKFLLLTWLEIPQKVTAYILVFILAKSPEFPEQDGFRNRGQAGVGGIGGWAECRSSA